MGRRREGSTEEATLLLLLLVLPLLGVAQGKKTDARKEKEWGEGGVKNLVLSIGSFLSRSRRGERKKEICRRIQGLEGLRAGTEDERSPMVKMKKENRPTQQRKPSTGAKAMARPKVPVLWWMQQQSRDTRFDVG
ncbi:hypothetical protein M406DRAFT_335185 [Cryphonectria parasitica EP155]|uniref:Uncharacterized protein n=1 Tax=Cryphonectria parasitica (strain ATCC 38755 / EP155) TaxID=660469 RepID=A0A9P4XS11_CRYP1|nr:uncharacterized protein M406DRAFT_335185 [Cryphonectria parasitica EP155]KAF3759973.1 hypothetical protein M406DRAFT_335185 [Cryphonectria parasitica EP155]